MTFRPLIMGVVNITPDSFSDGGQYTSPESFLSRIHELLADGANIVEIGAESTRPGSTYVDESEEIRRLSPILPLLHKVVGLADFCIDTRRPSIMRRASDCGVTYFNNVEGLADDSTLRFLADRKHKYIAMHMHRTPVDMQKNPLCKSSALDQVSHFFSDVEKQLIEKGFSKEQVYVDPGIGFGKDDSANLALIQAVNAWSKVFRIAIGISRKGFLTRLFGANSLAERDMCSKIIETHLIQAGAHIIRTHAVHSLRKILESIAGTNAQ